MLTDAEIARFVAWLEAEADNDEIAGFPEKAKTMRSVVARLLEEHKNRKP